MSEPNQALTKPKILVVDDMEDNRIVISRRLALRGYDVIEAASGGEAISLVATESPDAVLLDFMMPGISGIDVLRSLREHHDAASLPILMVTARSEVESVVQALEVGANDYVTKPISFPVLLARLTAHLDRSVAQRELAEMNAVLEQRIAERTRVLALANQRLLQEVTERAAAEASLSTALAAAANADRAKTQFLASMTHGLRMPLSAVIGFADLMLKEARGPLGAVEYREYALEIVDASRRLLATIDDLITLSKIESGGVDLSGERFKINEFLVETARAFKGRTGGVTVLARENVPNVEAFADRRALKQALSGMVGVLLRWTPIGATITLEGQVSSDVVELKVTGEQARLGERDADTMFEIGARTIHAGDAPDLGAIIAKGLIEAHGGRMEISAEKGVAVRLIAPCLPEVAAIAV